MEDKCLLTRIGEAIDQRRQARKRRQTVLVSDQTSACPKRLFRWLPPTFGTVIFTLLVIGGLVWAQSVGAISLGTPNAVSTSTGTLAYQGRLATSSGQPLTQTVNMSFRLYNAASGGTSLWTEQWTGASSVQVSDGLFNVMLGSLTPIPQTVLTGNSNLFLGITVGTDGEMTPRVQLGSVPFATQALTVPDGSITTVKLANDFILPMVPRMIAYINKQNDIWLNSSPTGAPQTIETIPFTLPSAPTGYRWDLEWRINQRFGAMTNQSVTASFLLDGNVLKDSNGVAFAENGSLSIQSPPMDNMIFGGTVYQNNVASGNHTLTWQISAWGNISDQFLVRQRWLSLTAILVPASF